MFEDEMRLSVITDEISQDFAHALSVMSEFGVSGAELRGLWGVNIADLSQEQIATAKADLAAANIVVSALSTPVFKCELDEDEAGNTGPLHLAQSRTLADQPALLRKCAAIGREFGTNLIRVFGFWKKGELTPARMDRIVGQFQMLVTIAEEEDVILLLENEHACLIGTGSEAADVLGRVNSPRLRACWDPGNCFMAGERPFPDGYNAIAHYLGHVHVKDAVVPPDGGNAVWAIIGQGDIDYKGQFEALRNCEYNGWVSLETHYLPPGGTPEEGSRLCLTALKQFIKD